MYTWRQSDGGTASDTVNLCSKSRAPPYTICPLSLSSFLFPKFGGDFSAATLVARCPPLNPQLKFWAVQVTPCSTISIRTVVQMNSTIAKATPDATGVGEAAEGSTEDMVVQYVVLRRDLIDNWPLGSIVTQGCHASVAAIWANKDDHDTVLYCSPPNLDSMHKVTLEVKGETQMVNLSEKLKVGGIVHKLWIEQPENIPTCLATKSYPKSFVSSFFKNLKLCK